MLKNWLVDIWENNIKYEKLIKLNYNSAAQSQKKEACLTTVDSIILKIFDNCLKILKLANMGWLKLCIHYRNWDCFTLLDLRWAKVLLSI